MVKNDQLAFPSVTTLSYEEGMTLRDYFAAQAMQGYIASGQVEPDRIAEWAYQHADAMLKARTKEEL